MVFLDCMITGDLTLILHSLQHPKIRRLPKSWGYPKNGLLWKILLTWMIWGYLGYHHFRKHPYVKFEPRGMNVLFLKLWDRCVYLSICWTMKHSGFEWTTTKPIQVQPFKSVGSFHRWGVPWVLHTDSTWPHLDLYRGQRFAKLPKLGCCIGTAVTLTRWTMEQTQVAGGIYVKCVCVGPHSWASRVSHDHRTLHEDM